MPKKKKTTTLRKSALQKQTDKQINDSFSENALKMMKKRYLFTYEDGRQETPADMFRRVARSLAEVEKNYGKDKKFISKLSRDFFEIMSGKEYTPAGRTLTNVGTPQSLIANCIVLPVLDSMESIFQTLKEAALLQQAGSGLGFDFSHLRPAMAPTKGSRGVASGPVSFLKVYDAAFGIIKQQNRAGANMGMMHISHPDVLDFIRSKEVEGEIRNFNISVKVTDDFMRAVLDNPNEQWYCKWKNRKMKPRKVLRAKNGSVVGIEEIDITAKELFDELVHYAWLNGEPGIVFIDEVNRTNPLPGLGEIDCSNPCVVGETLVPTEKGLLPIREIAEKYGDGNVLISTDARMPEIISSRYQSGLTILNNENRVAVLEKTKINLKARFTANPILKAWKSGTKPAYKLETKSGYEIIATKDHKILTTDGKVELGKLTPSHKILIQPREGLFNSDSRLPFEVKPVFNGKNSRTYRYNFPEYWSKELGQVLGLLIGDGWIRDRKKQETVGFTFGSDDKEVLVYIKKIIDGFYGSPVKTATRENGVVHLMYSSRYFVDYIKKFGVTTAKADKKRVPETIFTAPKEAVIGFLQGLFTADGTVANQSSNGNRYLRLTSKSRKLLKEVQILLLNLGIKSSIYDRSRTSRKTFSYVNKRGEFREYKSDGILYELNISKENLANFLEKIGFLPGKHEYKLSTLMNHSYRKISFDDEIKSITYVGVRDVYDLTEPFTSSFIGNGIVISNCGEQFLHHYDNCNLGSINLAKFVKTGRVDWGRLRRVTKIATRLMDNVVDKFDFPVRQVTDLARKNRRIGLGIMGFADMLYQLGIPYNSFAGQKMAERVMKTITQTAHETSRGLAKEKGAFPNIKKSVFAKKVKMRNAALSTVAPTGSISMMLDASSGIEPNFALSYVKQDKDGQQYHYFNQYFDEALKKHNFTKKKTLKIKDEIIRTGSIQKLDWLLEELRRTFVVSMDISAEDHMKMQAAFQRQVDNSISKTINFPNSATEEDVANGYLLAWKLKCKSATVYRDGSRTVQILNLGTGEGITAPSELGKSRAAPLPLKLSDNNGNGLIPRSRPEVMTGKTHQIKTGYGNLYITINEDERGRPFEVFATIGKSGGFFQEQSEAICRMVSLALRSGIKVSEVIEQLKGIRGPMPVMTSKGTVLSLPDAIGRILEEHVRGNGYDFENEEPLIPAVSKSKEEGGDGGIFVKQVADFGYMPGCPDCGAELQMAEGCISCKNCGFSRCL